MAKEVIFEQDARSKILEGVDGLANAVETQAERRDNCIKYLIEVGGELS